MNKFTKTAANSASSLGLFLSKAFYLTLCALVLFAATAQAQTTYYWRGNTTGNAANQAAWSNAANWNTAQNGSGAARDTPLPTDILIFDGSLGIIFPAFIVVDYGSGGNAPTSQTINQLRFVNNANVTLAGPTNANDGSILNIGGGVLPSGNADDFFVGAGSRLTVLASGNTSNRFLLMKIAAGKKGLVNGAITFNAGSNTFTRLVAADAGSLVFGATGSFTATTVNGSPFGTTGTNSLTGNNGSALGPDFTEVTVANAVVFNAGATYTQQNGLSPFGTGPTAVSVFNSGSFYVFEGGTFSATGQTYGNLEFTNSIATVNGAQTLTVLNNLTMTGGVFNDNITGGTTGTGTVLLGNLLANGGTINFAPSGGPGRVGFGGTSVQTISGAGALNFGPNAQVQVNNGAGLVLQRNVLVEGLLILTNGLITTTRSTALLTLGNGVGVQGGSSASYVNGPVARLSGSGTNSDLIFPVGKSGNYRPLFLSTAGQSAAATYIGEQIETPPNQLAITSPLTRVSFVRYFQLAPTTAVTLTSAAVTLSFGLDDFANFPADPTFVIARNDFFNGPWSNAGRSGSTGTANGGLPVTGTLTSAAFTAFATGASFTLASTGTVPSFPGVNPLPVELTRFAAATKPNGIALDWTTASEKNSAYFEVQRSANGETFQVIARIKAQGNSSAAHTYSALDRAPLKGLAHYRLRQVDNDGTAAYSPVVTARSASTATPELYPNPSHGMLYVTGTEGPVRYRVLNGQGQPLLNGETAGTGGIDVTPLPAGIYLLEILTGNARTVKRFVRQ